MESILCGSLNQKIGSVVEARMGRIPFTGRYHRHRALEDDYIISQSILGSGTNNDVLLALGVSQPCEKFAVKSLQLDNLTLKGCEQLEAEVQNYLSMDHPHIARLHDVYETEHQLHLVMECLDGGDLFARVEEETRFSEEDARDMIRQMLLALNYIHSHGIAHRDIKLENFVFDKEDSTHLKLIDFGFSCMCGQEKMHKCCGTVAYAAPEVLNKNYTSQCDLWSLGVIGFILLSGGMPFFGPDADQIRNIRNGNFTMRPQRWNTVSGIAKDFILKLLEISPSKRLTAQNALEHIWIAKSSAAVPQYVTIHVVSALKQYSHASKIRRCCMEMLAWSLSNEECAKVRGCFLSFDADHSGGISWIEFKHIIIDQMQAADEHEALQMFEALDYNSAQEIHYSSFLAAMLGTSTKLDKQHLHAAFRRFDTDGTGCITLENLQEVLGNATGDGNAEDFMEAMSQGNDGSISFSEFAAYLAGEDTVSAAPSTCAGDATQGTGEGILSVKAADWKCFESWSSTTRIQGFKSGHPIKSRFSLSSLLGLCVWILFWRGAERAGTLKCCGSKDSLSSCSRPQSTCNPRREASPASVGISSEPQWRDWVGPIAVVAKTASEIFDPSVTYAVTFACALLLFFAS
jgi:calcium-dependent protein kinase